MSHISSDKFGHIWNGLPLILIHDVCLFVCYCKKRHNNICEFIICCEYFRPQARFKHWQNIKEKSTRFKIRDKTFTFIMISPLVQLGWRPVHGRNRQSTAHKWIKEDDLMKITFTFLQIISSDWFVWKRNKRNAKKPPSFNLPQAPPTWLSPPSSSLLACRTASGRGDLHSKVMLGW